jgi:hypothetical protein
MGDQDKRTQLGISPMGEVCGVGANGGMLDAEKAAEEILAPLVRYVRQ